MKKIYESDFNGWDERAEAVAVYELEEGEYDELCERYENEVYRFDDELLLEDMGLHSSWNVMPGARYSTYFVGNLTTHHLIVFRVDALNV